MFFLWFVILWAIFAGVSLLAHWTVPRRVNASLQLAFKVTPFAFPRPRQVIADSAFVTHLQNSRPAPVLVMCQAFIYFVSEADIMPRMFQVCLKVN